MMTGFSLSGAALSALNRVAAALPVELPRCRVRTDNFPSAKARREFNGTIRGGLRYSLALAAGKKRRA